MLKSQKIATAIAVVAALLMSSLTINAQNNRGYKGMFNAGWILLSEDVGFEALTIHGYQINPHLFVGGGAGINYYSSGSDDAGYIGKPRLG